MKKYLMILSTLSAIVIGTITNAINTQENNTKTILDTKNQAAKYSTDISKYNLNENDRQEFQLINLLNLFKEINQEQKENNIKIKFNRFPRWNMINDIGLVFALGWTFEAAQNLENLINSDFIQFKNVWIYLTKDVIVLYLDYQIADISQTIKIFEFNDEYKRIPFKQDKMQRF